MAYDNQFKPPTSIEQYFLVSMQSSVRQIRSAGEPHHHVSIIQPSPTFHQPLDSSASSDDANREGLYNFLHDELRISSDTANSYCNSLQSNGYDDVTSLQDATEQDLKDMGVKIGHIRRIKRVVFASCMRDERRRKNVVEVLEESLNSRKSLEGSLLSDYARQEMIKWSPSIKDPHIDSTLVDAREFLIRKQAEKIATLEAKLASTDMNHHNHLLHHHHGHGSGSDEMKSLASVSSRGGSVDSPPVKKLTPEERLQAHKERKEQENKYKEKTGVWEAPKPLHKGKSLAKKVSENDDLVLKLTADPTQRKKIDEIETATKKANRKMLRSGGDAPPNRPPLSPSSRSLRRDSRDNERHYEGSHSSQSSPGRRVRHYRSSSPQISCQTCGSCRDCEEDIDNPGIFYCKPCWNEYETSFVEAPVLDISSQTAGEVSIEDDVHHALWVVHDNPQLGQNIIYSGPRRMECMLETKDPHKKGCVRIIIGDIDYSGKVEHAGIGNKRGNETHLGEECIRIRNARGFYVDHAQVTSKLSKDKSVYEMHLDDESAHVLTGKAATKSVADFFQDCNGAIDVILDPQRDFGGWYPQKEAQKGGRKIAPQFRSKGVGYIRLGDDMGENGLAFLSSNSCSTFLSTASRMSSKTSKSTSPVDFDEPKNAAPAVSVGKNSSSRNNQSKLPPNAASQDESDNSDSDEEGPEDDLPKVSDVLKQLQSPDMIANMKWKEKAELLSYLGQGASKEDGRQVRPAALNIIQDTLGGKNVNVHVIRSALIASGMIGIAMGPELASQMSWKAIMIETMKLLKSKQCGSVAKTVLAQLHGRCFTLANSLEFISHVLGLGSTASAPKSRKSRVGVSKASPNPRRTSAVNGNSGEVIQWLAEITERERNLKVIDPMLEKSSLVMLINIFLSYVDHRDQRCRKNVMNGLMQAVLYGVQRLGLDLTRVMRMCSGLKETNPKGWNKIYQNAQAHLD
ncbi:hypothetical protein ACHAWT_010314 [Skeletonema menzelii]